jgi:hypothetical protein
VDHRGTGLSTDEVLKRLLAGGVIASPRPPRQIRLVTNRHHDVGVIDEAVERVRRALAGV